MVRVSDHSVVVLLASVDNLCGPLVTLFAILSLRIVLVNLLLSATKVRRMFDSHGRILAWISCCVASVMLVASGGHAAVTSSSLHGFNHDDFDGLLFDDDLIQGLSEEPIFFGDPGVYENDQFPITGWHPANNVDPADQLPSFTDGVGERGTGLTGLLNDNLPGAPPAPISGAPVKIVEYVLAEPSDIGRINILTGNRNNSDGRIFLTTSILYSTDGGASFDDLGYFESDPSGVFNNEVSPESPLDPEQASTITSIFNDASTTMLTGVTNIELSFYAVSIFGGPGGDVSGVHVDPFDGVNTFTGVDDGFGPAFISPLVWEIDVVAPASQVVGDYNGDGSVNIADYTVWRNSLGSTVSEGTGADGNLNGVIDADDYTVWKLYFGAADGSAGTVATAAVPEPATFQLVALLAAAVVMFRRRGIQPYCCTPT